MDLSSQGTSVSHLGESLNSAQNLVPGEMLSSDIQPWSDSDSALTHSIRSQ